MVSAAKHLSAQRDRLFASLRASVAQGDSGGPISSDVPNNF
jgi:hypothetical protein